MNIQCPSCGQMTSIHSESAARGMEIVCHRCGAILAVEQTHPLILIEAGLKDDE